MAKRPTLDAVSQAANDATATLYGDPVGSDNPLIKMMFPFVLKAQEWQDREWGMNTREVTAKTAAKLFKESANVIV